MIKNWLITGDTHGRVMERLNQISTPPEETAIIILGDAGINFYLNNTDQKNKRVINNSGFTIYCVRGNHEERPENLEYPDIYDENVNGDIYIEPLFPNIRYFIDGGEYIINNHKILVIGGAYSVDKWYRLSGYDPETQWTGWFKDEQLTAAEMTRIEAKSAGKDYDFIFSHTCPISWEPTDLFIRGLDQSKIDKTMELWLDNIKDTFSWKVWCFGHFHDDRIERPRVEMYFHDIEDIEVIWNRWNGEKTFENEWWLQKSPHFYLDDIPWSNEYKKE